MPVRSSRNPGWFDVRDYGAITTGSSPTADQRTANTSAVQGAIDAAEVAGGVVYLPFKAEIATNALTVTSPSVTIRGVARGSTILSTNSGVLLTLTGGYYFNVEHLTLRSRSGGGHIFSVATSLSHARFHELELIQDNAAKSVYYHSGNDYLDVVWDHINITMPNTASVAAWYIRSNAPNASSWRDVRANGAGYYFWDIEPTSNYANGLIIDRVTGEFNNGGLIRLAGARNCQIRNVAMYDFNTYGGGAISRDLISIEAAATGNKSQNIVFDSVVRLEGTLDAGKYDIKIVTNTATAYFTFINCGYVSAANFAVDLNFVRALSIESPHVTWTNSTGLVKLHSESGIEGIRIGADRAYVPVFHVDACGATGDGTTDDATAIQAAYTAANTAGGGRVVYRNGKTYVIGSGITVYGNTETDFNGATVKTKTGTTGFNMFVSGNVNKVRYRNGVIDLNKANVTDPASINLGIGIYYACTSGNSFGNEVSGVEIKNGHQVGIRMQGHNAGTTPSSMNPSEIDIHDCAITGCKYGIYLTRVSNYRVYKNRIDDCADAGITLNFHRDGVIEGNLVEDTTSHGIVCVYGIGYAIANNVVRRAGVSGIANGGGSYTADETNRYYTVIGNVCEGCTAHGITNDPTITSGTFELTCATITGNVCRDNGSHGIYCQNVKRITLTGNECMDNTNSGIANFGSYHTIVGNHCYDNGAYGIDVQGASGGDAEGYHSIHSNNLHGNSSGNLTLSQYLTDVDGAYASATKDWADLASGAEQTQTVTCYGAALGMVAQASMSVDLAGTKLLAYVSAANTVTVIHRNDTGGNVNLASGTLRVVVRRIS